MVPGAVYAGGSSNQDVGGNKGEYSQNFMIHGGRGNDFAVELRLGLFGVGGKGVHRQRA